MTCKLEEVIKPAEYFRSSVGVVSFFFAGDDFWVSFCCPED
jgi:hypothetical protein